MLSLVHIKPGLIPSSALWDCFLPPSQTRSLTVCLFSHWLAHVQRLDRNVIDRGVKAGSPDTNDTVTSY